MQQEFLIAATVMAMSLLAGAALILSFLPWKAHPVDYQKAQRVDPGIEREFNKLGSPDNQGDRESDHLGGTRR